ncbi:twin-arginine translocase subunit TatC [Haladaptatus sp. CMAA 1911]|uniref:twin-arginine translocase subunit TatC n=1 Tax=unclassified Haladaptatus TaxID=2622732 RepID=UPI003755276B
MGEESEATAGSNISNVSASDEAPEPPDEDLYVPEDPEPAVERPSQPTDDEEMPLADHVEEMIKRLAIVLVVAGAVSLLTLPAADHVINFLWNQILPVQKARPRLYAPLALVMTKLKVASLAGLIIALPVMVYQTYLFMRPGLYPNERRYYLAAVPTSLVLAFVGVSFAYFLILPAIFTYFLSYSQQANVAIAFGLTKTFNLILMMMGVLAVVFQIPLLIMLAIMMGLTTRQWMANRRLYFWGGFAGFAFLFSPDPTGMAPFLVAITMVGLFEGTLLLLKWTGK